MELKLWRKTKVLNEANINIANIAENNGDKNQDITIPNTPPT